MSETCETCKAGDFSDERPGLCRRKSPPFYTITTDDWCLDWRPKARNFSTPRQGKHAIPDDWKPSEDCVLLAKSLGINAYSEAAKMRDHARYTKRLVADWDAAFRNWLRKGQR